MIVSLESMSYRDKQAIGHTYLEVTYVTIQGAGGSTRVWTYELADWLLRKPGTLIVALREI